MTLMISISLPHSDSHNAEHDAPYPYYKQLRELENSSLRRDMGHPLPPHLSDIVTPVTLEFWERELSSHPDKPFSQLIIRGLKRGFHIGFQKPDAGLKTARSNMLSAL